MLPGQKPRVHHAAEAASKRGVGGMHQPAVKKPQGAPRPGGNQSPAQMPVQAPGPLGAAIVARWLALRGGR